MKRPKRTRVSQVAKEVVLRIKKSRQEYELFAEKLRQRELYVRSEEERYSTLSRIKDARKERQERRNSFYGKTLFSLALLVLASLYIYALFPGSANNLLTLASALLSNISRLASFVLEPFLQWSDLEQDPQIPQKDKFSASLEISKLLLSLLGTVATLYGAFMLIRNYKVANRQAEIANEQAKIAQTRFATETFSKAIEQLESEKMAVRVGAIYALERIADSPSFYWMTVNVLCAVIRDRASITELYLSSFRTTKNSTQEEIQKEKERTNCHDFMYAKDKKVAIDIAAIISVLGKPSPFKEAAFLEELNQIDLSTTELIGMQVVDADFRGCYFRSTDFRCAHIYSTNFRETVLHQADFRWAKVYFTNFFEASLIEAKFNQTELVKIEFNEANLWCVDFSEARLKGCIFDQSNLSGAIFHYADLSGVSFHEAKLSEVLEGKLVVADFRGAKNLDSERIKQASGWKQAIYDEEFRQKLGLEAPDINT